LIQKDFFLFKLLHKAECARGGSRSGGSRSGSIRGSGSGSSSRGSGSSSSSSSRFSFSRSIGYSYGTFSGARYGTSIRRTAYWPIYRIGYGYPFYYNYYNSYYYYNQRPDVASITTDAELDIDISESFTKIGNKNY